ncbi:hypothetical protein BH23CHL8_BH23CHL8_00740 [soil metagenome]
MAFNRAVGDLGDLLAERRLAYELVIIGGATLLLRGMVTRAVTQDVDVVAEVRDGRLVAVHEIDPKLATAVRDVAALHGLLPDWLNTAPSGLMDLGLPAGFQGRLTSERWGGLTLHHPAREDMVAFKLYAVVDGWPSQRTRHVGDLRALRPTPQELLSAARWTRTHDPSPAFRANMLTVLRFLGLEVADVDID